jgi:hypothetical protein
MINKQVDIRPVDQPVSQTSGLVGIRTLTLLNSTIGLLRRSKQQGNSVQFILMSIFACV